jgi:hypothetical protein
MSVRVFLAGKRWAGIFPALSTPTDRRGRLDEAGLGFISPPRGKG